MLRPAQLATTRCLDGLIALIPLFLQINILAWLFLSMMLGDMLVFQWQPAFIPEYLWFLLDPPVHAAVSLLVVSPLLLRPASTGRLVSRISSALVAAIFIDLDHFVAAGGPSLFAATHLNGRPVTHSLIFALACGLLALLLTHDPLDGWLIFGSLSAHFLRDASGGGTPYLFWPLASGKLPQAAYYASEAGLCLGMKALSGLKLKARERAQGAPELAPEFYKEARNPGV